MSSHYECAVRRVAAFNCRKSGGSWSCCRLLFGLLTLASLCVAYTEAVERHCSHYGELYHFIDKGAGNRVSIQSKCYPNGTVKYSWGSSNVNLVQIEYQCHNLNISGSSSTSLKILSNWSDHSNGGDDLTIESWQPSSYCDFSGCYRDFPNFDFYYVEKVQCTTPAVCGAPSPLINGSMEGLTESTLEGSTVVYQCNPGFSPQTRHSSECTVEGVWSWDPAEFHCKKNCTEPTTNGTLVLEFHNGTTEGAVVWYECSDGLLPKGRWSAVCTPEGIWDPDPAIFNCKEPEPTPSPSLPLVPTPTLSKTLQFNPSATMSISSTMDPPLSRGTTVGIAVGAGAGALVLIFGAIFTIRFLYKCSRAKGVYQRQVIDMNFSPVDPGKPVLANAPSQATILEALKASLFDVSAGNLAGTPSIPNDVIARDHDTGFEENDYGRLGESRTAISTCSILDCSDENLSQRLEDVHGERSDDSDSASFTVDDGDVSSSDTGPYCSDTNDGARQVEYGSSSHNDELLGIETDASDMSTLVTMQDEATIMDESHQSLQHADIVMEARESFASPVHATGLQHVSEVDMNSLHLSGQQWQEQSESRYVSSGASSTGYVVMLPDSL